MPANKNITPTEEKEQIMFAVWLDKSNIPYFAIPNGGSRNYLEAVKFKRMGVKRGIPDIFIPLPVYPYNGLFIELKRTKGGVTSDHQKYWLDKLTTLGYKAEICRGFEEAKTVVSNYLKS